MSIELREKLARLAHEQWSGWMKYMFGKCRKLTNGKMIIPKWAVERWSWQMVVPYDDLSEEEKNSDRTEADKFLALLSEDKPCPQGEPTCVSFAQYCRELEEEDKKMGYGKISRTLNQKRELYEIFVEHNKQPTGEVKYRISRREQNSRALANATEDKRVQQLQAELKTNKQQFKDDTNTIQQLQAELAEYVEQEAIILPEDVGFVEYIKAIRIERDGLQAELEESKQEADMMWEGLNSQILELQTELAEARTPKEDKDNE